MADDNKKLFTPREAAQAVLAKTYELLSKSETLNKYETENRKAPGVKYGKIEKDQKPIERDYPEYEVKSASFKDSSGKRLERQVSPSGNPKEEAEGNNNVDGMEPRYEFKDKVKGDLAKENAQHMVKSQSGMHTVTYKMHKAEDKAMPKPDLGKAETGHEKDAELVNNNYKKERAPNLKMPKHRETKPKLSHEQMMNVSWEKHNLAGNVHKEHAKKYPESIPEAKAINDKHKKAAEMHHAYSTAKASFPDYDYEKSNRVKKEATEKAKKLHEDLSSMETSGHKVGHAIEHKKSESNICDLHKSGEHQMPKPHASHEDMMKMPKNAHEEKRDFHNSAESKEDKLPQNPDKEADAELGEKVEHDVEDHFKENQEAEAKEGHELMAKPENKSESETEKSVIPRLVLSAKLSKFMEHMHSKRKNAEAQSPQAVGHEATDAPAPRSTEAGQPIEKREGERGIHLPHSETDIAPGSKLKGDMGQSGVGSDVRDMKRDIKHLSNKKTKGADRRETIEHHDINRNRAINEHKQVLSDMKAMPKPKLPG